MILSQSLYTPATTSARRRARSSMTRARHILAVVLAATTQLKDSKTDDAALIEQLSVTPIIIHNLSLQAREENAPRRYQFSTSQDELNKVPQDAIPSESIQPPVPSSAPKRWSGSSTGSPEFFTLIISEIFVVITFSVVQIDQRTRQNYQTSNPLIIISKIPLSLSFQRIVIINQLHKQNSPKTCRIKLVLVCSHFGGRGW